MKNGHHSTPILALLLILAAGLGVIAGCVSGSIKYGRYMRKVESVYGQKMMSPYATWQTYTDNARGFSFSMPQGYHASAPKNISASAKKVTITIYPNPTVQNETPLPVMEITVDRTAGSVLFNRWENLQWDSFQSVVQSYQDGLMVR